MPTPVPYTGTEAADPQQIGIAPVHVDTPLAAFGGAVAGAISHLGDVTASAGRELFDRAYAMQELNVHAQTNEQIAKYQDDLVGLRSNLAKYQGKDLTDHIPDFLQQTEDLRQKYLGGITSPLGKQMFDDESRSSRFRVVFSAGSEANDQLKSYDVNSTRLGIAADGNLLANTDPFDDNAVAKTLDKATKDAEHLALVTPGYGLHPGDPGYDEFIRAHTSMALRPSFEEWLKKPVEGDAAFEHWRKLGKISDDDYRDYKPRFLDAIRTKGVADIAAKIDNGGFAPGGQGPLPPATVQSILPRVSGTGGYETIGREDPNGNGHPVGQYGLASADLAKRLADAGMKPMTEADFLKDHAAQDQLANSFFTDAQKRYGSFNEALTAWTGGIDSDSRVAAAQKEIAQSAKHSDRATMVDQTAAKLGLDPVATERLHQQVAEIQARREADIAKDNHDYSDVISDALLGVGAPNGKVPTSRQELMSLPGMQDAVAKLNQTPDGKRYLSTLDKSLDANLRRGGYVPTAESLAQLNELRGIFQTPTATPQERKKLLDVVPSALPWPTEMVTELRKMQKDLYNGVAADPNMATAMGVMQPVLQSMGITKTANPTEYYKFVGAFQSALKGETAGELRVVKDGDTIRRIGMMVLAPNQRAEPNWLGSHPLTYQSPGDTASRAVAEQTIRGQLKKMGIDRDPTDEEINKATLLLQFEQSGRSGKLTNRVPGAQ